jgi:hypothetical protein
MHKKPINGGTICTITGTANLTAVFLKKDAYQYECALRSRQIMDLFPHARPFFPAIVRPGGLGTIIYGLGR